MRKLRSEIRVYAAIERHYGRRPGLGVLRNGVRGWLDGFTWLARTEECGCARLGGGGRHYCTTEHFAERMGISDDR